MIRYTVISVRCFENAPEGKPFLACLNHAPHFTDIVDAEAYRIKMLKEQDWLTPQNTQVIQYRVGD